MSERGAQSSWAALQAAWLAAARHNASFGPPTASLPSRKRRRNERRCRGEEGAAVETVTTLARYNRCTRCLGSCGHYLSCSPVDVTLLKIRKSLSPCAAAIVQPQRRPSEPPPQPRAAAAPGDRSRAGSVSARPADRVYIEEVNIAKATEKASTCFTSPGEEPNVDLETREARYP